jgi:hypothetical protein
MGAIAILLVLYVTFSVNATARAQQADSVPNENITGA